jgi:hypothetical protein
MGRRIMKGEVWRWVEKERVRLREDPSGWWWKADIQGRYARWTGPYTTEEVAYHAAERLILTGFAGEVNGGD